ncbi:uncharacterized protein VDAG_02833 [Verticillium dahliae VdLs.17]|uniref:Uncharacterized protein n=1 Tax=Verticillium dahliae (strain VdLs.17 / ATCC MYA-4575 / FGSC 10137) TaxID=498257 RepID=G2WX54_VERDV|nr:uncharacterized protein VDAG_02833 [Verticillium dahliae VdLs.17]EGY21309.1 hypothetical protein VDAG_02833 [Verticillium dahliae VdLs.17]KAH6707304.1 hypothetical protein EV126DRAFT_333029 [Verticillium dahliae]
MVRGKFWPFTGARSSSRQLPNAIRVRAIPVATSQETWETPREYRVGAAERPRNPQGYVDRTCFLAHLFFHHETLSLHRLSPSLTRTPGQILFLGHGIHIWLKSCSYWLSAYRTSSHKDAKRPSKGGILTRHVRSRGA